MRWKQKLKLPSWSAGELPLSLAACTKQWDVVTYLLENPHQPASLEATDSLGNTVLHALVMIADNSPENSALVIHMYDGLLQVGVRLCPTVQLEDICNHEGLTPLKLAAKEGKIEVSTAPPSPASLSCSRTRADNSYKYITHSGFSRPGPFIISPLSCHPLTFLSHIQFFLFCLVQLS